MGLALVALLLLWVLATQAMASLSVPYTLMNGQPNDATQVMADFNAIVSYINNLTQSGTARNGRQVTGGGTVAGNALTDGVVVVVNSTTYPTTYQLPTNPTANQWVTVKDGSPAGYGFEFYNCTVTTTDGSLIDGGSGSTGVTIRSDRGSQDFVFINSAWWKL